MNIVAQKNEESDLEKYIRLLHTNFRGLVCLSQATNKGTWLPELFVPASKVNQIINKRNNINNQYISVNEFNKNCSRKENNITQLRSLFIDIDIKHNDNIKFNALSTNAIDNILSDSEAFILLEDINDALATINCPTPTLIINSGRGLQMYWSFKPVPKSYLPSYKQLQQKIYGSLKHLGADANALDASRVLRIPETLNTRSGTQASIIGGNEYVYDIFELIEELGIKQSPHEAVQSVYIRNGKPYISTGGKQALECIVSNLAIKTAMNNAQKTTYNKSTTPILALHNARLADYIKLLEGKYRGIAPAGKRELLLFLMVVSLGKINTDINSLKEAAYEINNRYIHTTNEDVDAKLQTLFNMLEDNKNYKYSANKIIELLDISEDDMHKYNLRTLITHDIRKQRNRERKTDVRREEYLTNNKITRIAKANSITTRRTKKLIEQGFINPNEYT